MYGFKFWALNKKEETKTKVAEIKTLMQMCGVTRSSRISSEHTIRTSLGEMNVARKM